MLLKKLENAVFNPKFQNKASGFCYEKIFIGDEVFKKEFFGSRNRIG